ncbi:MAG: hypothetical protein FJW35_12275, partial [Acidobacteria bacterium]|nr:hypothetical protein [Acidobacteriota bacterium]
MSVPTMLTPRHTSGWTVGSGGSISGISSSGPPETNERCAPSSPAAARCQTRWKTAPDGASESGRRAPAPAALQGSEPGHPRVSAGGLRPVRVCYNDLTEDSTCSFKGQDMKMEFHVGDYLVQPHRNCVTCPDSSIRELKPEAMEVLTLLAEHQGQIVSKERILQTIWGSPWGTEDALTEAISDLKAIFEHAAGAPRFIQMVPQRGYCLTARVAVPESAGRYKVLQQIGEGATARVFLAHDAKLDRQVALKVLSTGALADEPMRRRFHNEARTLSKLNHQNIEIIHDVGTEGGCDFLVTEFIQGQTLRDKLAEGALPEAEIIRLACQLVDGLRAAHGQGVIHRDLKPSNMMLTLEGRLKIIDFGLA